MEAAESEDGFVSYGISRKSVTTDSSSEPRADVRKIGKRLLE